MGAANIVVVYFILALLIERACEVAMDLLTAVGAVIPKDRADPTSVQNNRRAVSVTICMGFAVVISLAGLRLVEMILVLATDTNPETGRYFAGMDVLLTALILAGGSDGIHQIMRKMLGERPPALAQE